jgi:hypothetical protein
MTYGRWLFAELKNTYNLAFKAKNMPISELSGIYSLIELL